MFNLNGKRGLVVGIANNKSIAYGCAKAFRLCGAEVAVTCCTFAGGTIYIDGGCHIVGS